MDPLSGNAGGYSETNECVNETAMDSRYGEGLPGEGFHLVAPPY